MSGSFRPINDAHAIVEAVIFCEFEKSFSSTDLTNLDDVRIQLEKDLPSYEAVLKLNVQASGNGGQLTSTAFHQEKVGFELKKFSTNGDAETRQLEWLLRVSANTISVHCLEYGRWEEYSSKVIGYLIACFKKIDLSNNALRALVLKYVDRFSYEGDKNDYDPSQLFNSETIFIAPKNLKRNDGRWHNHVGWFDYYPNEKDIEILNQLSIDAAYTSQKGEHFTTVDHNLILKPTLGNSNLGIDLPVDIKSPQREGFYNRINALHILNKKVMCDVLSSEMCKRMNLKVKS